MSRFIVSSALGILLLGCTPRSQPSNLDRHAVLRLAVTTSTRDSGLLDVLVPVFEKQQRARVDIIAVGTGAALKLGQTGDVDVVLVHARMAEDAFMAAGHGSRREDVMYNRFEILGPPNDPSRIRDLRAGPALQQIAHSGCRFVSRGDNSGTHQRELMLWQDGGGRMDWDGYVESGQGMGATLIMADQMSAYVVSDRGTYLKFRNKLKLVPLVASSSQLRNPYGIMSVDPTKHVSINGKLADAFLDFIISPRAQQLIGDYTIDGQQLFFPLHLPSRN